MKQYIYNPESIGLAEWPSGTLRLAGIEETKNPAEADIFVCPGSLSLFHKDGTVDKEKLYRLPHLKGNEQRNVFFDVSDNFTTPVNLPILFIRCDARNWMLPHDPGVIQFNWPVEDYAECVTVNKHLGHTYDISFQAWLSSDARKISSESCLQQGMLTCDFQMYRNFTGYIFETEEGLRRRREFRRSMRESRLALCPESIPGVLPYRFFEAMSAGRVPLLVSSNYVLPFESEIPYRDFILECPTEEAHNAGTVARNFIERTPDAEIIEKGRLARRYFESHMNRDKWPEFMARAVVKKLAEMGVAA